MACLSLGAGVQSSCLYLMVVHGDIERADHAIFADTGAEPESVYKWVSELKRIGNHIVPIHTVTAGNIAEDALSGSRFASIPFYLKNERGIGGKLRRQCTMEYKITPLQRWVRENRAGRKPVRMLIGISRDEAQRMKPSRVKYIVHEWPLIDLNMKRTDCVAWLEKHGYTDVPRSACVFCPYHSNKEWRRLQSGEPEAFAAAVDFDEKCRTLPRIRGEVFLHPSLTPLSAIDFRSTEEHGQGVIDLFGNECEGMCGV